MIDGFGLALEQLRPDLMALDWLSSALCEQLRPDLMGMQSDEYRCGACKSTRCNLFHTNSMGAVHLTAVPDMIIECLDCGLRFTL